jgi:hypothetical protein
MISNLFDHIAEERQKQERLLKAQFKNELPIVESGKEYDR